MWNDRPFKVNTSFGPGLANGRKLKRGGGSSPSCFSHQSKSMDRLLIRQGVPVLNRPTSKPSCRNDSLNPELASAIRPPGREFSPTCNKPRKKVPEVTTTVLPN